MKIGRNRYDGESDKRAYVLECEAEYERSLDSAVKTVSATEGVKIITLSGPSCSGKTTTAKKIVGDLTSCGHRVHVISIDDFYYDRRELVERAEENGTAVDFDSAASIDLETLKKSIDGILHGEYAKIPSFDFNDGRRTEMRTLYIDESDMFIFEGIQALYPEVTDLFGDHNFISIYVNVGEELKIGDEVFRPEEIRLFRRLVRDFNFRSSSPEFTLKIWQSVRSNEEKNIFPYCDRCDVKINSLLGYEVSMLKPYLKPLLETIPKGSEYYGKVQDIINKMRYIPTISREYIPKDSVFHEFLG